MFLIKNLALSLTDKKLDDYSSSTLDFYVYRVGELVEYIVIQSRIPYQIMDSNNSKFG